MASRDDFLDTLCAFEHYDAWDYCSTTWSTTYTFLHNGGKTTAQGTHSAPHTVSLGHADLVFSKAISKVPELTKLKRVYADKAMVFSKAGWDYRFVCRWTAATLSPGIESMVEQRAGPSNYLIVLTRKDWEDYSAMHTSRHVAESISMKIDDIRKLLSGQTK